MPSSRGSAQPGQPGRCDEDIAVGLRPHISLLPEPVTCRRPASVLPGVPLCLVPGGHFLFLEGTMPHPLSPPRPTQHLAQTSLVGWTVQPAPVPKCDLAITMGQWTAGGPVRPGPRSIGRAPESWAQRLLPT